MSTGELKDDFRFRLILAAVRECGDVARFLTVLEQDLQLALARQQNVAVADVHTLVIEGGGGLTKGGDGGQFRGADGQALQFERLGIDLEITLVRDGTPRGGGFDLEVAGVQGYAYRYSKTVLPLADRSPLYWNVTPGWSKICWRDSPPKAPVDTGPLRISSSTSRASNRVAPGQECNSRPSDTVTSSRTRSVDSS